MPHGLGFGEIIVLLIPLLIVVLPAWRILKKAGYAGVWALLALVPLVNVIAFYIFAFTEWPLERRAREFDPAA